MLLRDDQWVRIEPFLHGKEGDRGRTGADNRLFVEAVLWMARTGAPWRDLPPAFGPWNSVFRRFSRWADKGVWQASRSAKVLNKRGRIASVCSFDHQKAILRGNDFSSDVEWIPSNENTSTLTASS